MKTLTPIACAFLIVLSASAGFCAGSGPAASKVAWQNLFHIGKNLNRNIVMYDIGVSSPSGAFLAENPVRVYWICLEKDGRQEPLSALEERMAYGIDVKTQTPQAVEFIVKALPKKLVRVTLPNGKARAITQISGQDCQVKEIFIQARKAIPLPKVDAVIIKGISLATGADVSERVEKK